MPCSHHAHIAAGSGSARLDSTQRAVGCHDVTSAGAAVATGGPDAVSVVDAESLISGRWIDVGGALGYPGADRSGHLRLVQQPGHICTQPAARSARHNGACDTRRAMRADGLLEFRFQAPSYGPSLVIGESADGLEKRFTYLAEQYVKQIEFVSSELGPMGVEELERVGTALLVQRQTPGLDETVVADRVRDLKPHVSEVDAVRAAQFVARVEQEAGEQRLASS